MADESTSSIPVIDLSRAPTAVAADLLTAYGEVGFAYLVGHGVDDRLVAETFDAAYRFHALPVEAKLSVELDDRHRGYIAINTSTDRNTELATVTKPNQSASFMMMREAGPDDPAVAAGHYLAGPNQWPELSGFRATLERYHEALSRLGARVMALFFDALGAEDASALVDRWFEPATTWLRLLHYPPQEPQPDLYGSAPHVDYGAITILAQDEVGGLQVKASDGTWLDVPYRDNSFVLNTGSMMVRWSNGRLKATPHRVINRSGRERYSIPFFYDPDVTTVVEPLSCCVDDSRPARFGPELFGDFLRRELTAGYDRHASSDTSAGA
ncbi:MAG: isopenicillin N synthase family oxygenase [Acidimicrobiia bacterium]|nr:isopenicillin N synthase family oxygenase [Acidimicrobiia bacterium]